MHHKQPKTYFLVRFCTVRESWAYTKLDSQVEPRSVEAMNAICAADGILAFIGTKYMCGKYLAKLNDLREVDTTPCWTSLPEATIFATLGLCRNTSTTGKREIVFYGSPRVLTLSEVIGDYREKKFRYKHLHAIYYGTLPDEDPTKFTFDRDTGAVPRGWFIYLNRFECKDLLRDYSAWQYATDTTDRFRPDEVDAYMESIVEYLFDHGAEEVV